MTLIEMMVVIVIIAMISAAVGVSVMHAFARTQEKTAATAVRTIRAAVIQHRLEGGRGCPTMEELVESDVLDEDQSVLDPWEHPFAIVCEGSRIEVRSAGPDGRLDSDDDLTSARTGRD